MSGTKMKNQVNLMEILSCCLILLILTGVYGNLYHRKDLVIALDSSRSIKNDVYETSLDFMHSIVDYMSISPGTTRMALITFTSKAKLEFNFEQYVNRECIKRKLVSLLKRRRKGRTNIDAGLRKAIYLFTTYKGFAKDKEIYLFSDGKWNEGKDPTKSAEKLRKLGVKIRVFAIGANPNKRNLKRITGASCRGCYFRLGSNEGQQKKLIKHLTKRKESVIACKGRGFVHDECNRKCACINGKMRECSRVRSEFTTLSKEEKKRYIQAYYKITTEEPLKTRFIKFIRKHEKLFWKGIHEKHQFFPWHRWFVYQFENLMREADCRVTVPFWDWSYWNEKAWNIGLHIWRNDEFGLGGDGVESKEYCVQTGPFNASAWEHPAPENTVVVMQSSDSQLGNCTPKNYSGHHKLCLRRSFNSLPANLAHVLKTISIPCNKFGKFDVQVRENYHNDIHNEIGGQMCTDYAANSPEFFLHHGFLDNIWWRWQEKSVVCKNAYFGKKAWKLLDSPFETADFIDSFYQGECVRVTYDDFLRRVMKPGEKLGKERGATVPAEVCPESDSYSGDPIPRSAFSLLKDAMRKEREKESCDELD